MVKTTKKRHRKKIIFSLFALVIILICFYLFSVFQYIDDSKIVNKEAIIDWIKAETDIVEIDEIHYFQDSTAYVIVYGQDQGGKDWILFNPKNNTAINKIQLFPAEELMKRETIEKAWQEQCQGCTLKKSNPAMIKNVPLWEITYMDQNQGYVLEYFSLVDGSTYEKLQLYRKYNGKG